MLEVSVLLSFVGQREVIVQRAVAIVNRVVIVMRRTPVYGETVRRFDVVCSRKGSKRVGGHDGD